MDLSGRMNRGKWSPLSWKTVFNTALFQGAFLQEHVYLSDYSFHAVLNITETTNIKRVTEVSLETANSFFPGKACW